MCRPGRTSGRLEPTSPHLAAPDLTRLWLRARRWKDIRAHYTMHRMDARMQRFENMRTLAAMRKTLELTLLREDEASGEHVLDKTNSEQIMKIITLQSKEITLLHETTNKAAAAAAAANHLPGAGASKKRD